MTKNYFSLLTVVPILFSAPGTQMLAQENAPNIRVVVDMVQLNVAVTDNKGNYITGLRPSDFAIVEDNIPQKLATFGEGNEPAYRVADTSADGKTSAPSAGGEHPADQKVSAEDPSQSLGSMVAGANVFLLFDTSN